MDLRLEFIGTNESDVIATSCAYIGEKGSFKYTGIDNEGSPYYYLFEDYLGTPALVDMCYQGATELFDKNGISLGNMALPSEDNYYHYDEVNNRLYECNVTSHYGKQE